MYLLPFEGVPVRPYIFRGEQGYMENPSRVLLGSQSEEFGWFPSVSTNFTPIWVDTREVGHIHVLLPTLEYSEPVGSPAIPALTYPYSPKRIKLSHAYQNHTKK